MAQWKSNAFRRELFMSNMLEDGMIDQSFNDVFNNAMIESPNNDSSIPMNTSDIGNGDIKIELDNDEFMCIDISDLRSSTPAEKKDTDTDLDKLACLLDGFTLLDEEQQVTYSNFLQKLNGDYDFTDELSMRNDDSGDYMMDTLNELEENPFDIKYEIKLGRIESQTSKKRSYSKIEDIRKPKPTDCTTRTPKKFRISITPKTTPRKRFESPSSKYNATPPFTRTIYTYSIPIPNENFNFNKLKDSPARRRILSQDTISVTPIKPVKQLKTFFSAKKKKIDVIVSRKRVPQPKRLIIPSIFVEDTAHFNKRHSIM